MAKKRKHQPKSGAHKPRKGRSRAGRSGVGGESEGGGGIMQGMVRGLRQAAGVEKAPGKKKSSLLGNILWVLVIAAAAVWAFRNFSE